MNPCWYAFKNPDYLPGSFDPPCYGDDYDETQAGVERRFSNNFFAFFFVGFMAAALMMILAVYQI